MYTHTFIYNECDNTPYEPRISELFSHSYTTGWTLTTNSDCFPFPLFQMFQKERGLGTIAKAIMFTFIASVFARVVL